MQIKTSFITRGDDKVESLITYTISDGWYYCFVATIEEYTDAAPNERLRFKTPMAMERYFKIRLGSPKSDHSELYVSVMFPMAGNEWDEHWIDGKRDPDFPPIVFSDSLDENELDKDGAHDSQNTLSEAEVNIFEGLKKNLSPRFKWPASLCQFVFDRFDRGQLRPLRNTGMMVWADSDFEIYLWVWALIPTFARSSYLEVNYSQARGIK